ncbi:MAG: RNA polymerase sigma factor [Opitutaceae bacterium]|jgi:RNA polymerase sigma-70 factor (ECF subfamily)|nr:RNA polymerase sigma factor [Opitutaceae bacterium]
MKLPSETETAAAAAAAAADADASLISRAAQGSGDAFSELFNRYYPAIHAFAWRLTLCPAEAADIAQDTFIHAARSLGGFRREASFKNWLHTIAVNKSRDRHRQRLRRERLSSELAALQAGEDADACDDDIRFSGDGIAPRHVALRDALAALPGELREAVVLVYYENLNHAGAARILGCAESTVSWRIFRAKQKLKRRLRNPSLRE